MNVKFYMKGGHVITAKNVKNISSTRHPTTGDYSGYSVDWSPGLAPNYFSLSIPDIVAIVSDVEPIE